MTPQVAVPGMVGQSVGTSAAGSLSRRASVWLIMVSGLLTMPGTSSATVLPECESLAMLPRTTTGLRAVKQGPEGSPALRIAEGGQEYTEATRAAVHELRGLSGLTWEHLARLCGVTRRTLHFWASGKPLTAAHEERLQRLLATMRAIDRGSAPDTRSMLLQPSQDGVLPFDLLIDGEYDTVVALLGPGGRVRTPRTRTSLSAEAHATRQPPSPEELVGALQDRVHREVGKARPVRAIRMTQ